MTDMKITTEYTEQSSGLPHAESPDFYSRNFNDLEVSEEGDLAVITSTDELAQDILKMLTTTPGSQPYFQDYGVDFGDLIGTGQRNSTVPYITAQIKDRIVNGLKAMQETLVNRPDNEQIGALTYFDVQYIADEVKVEFTVLTKSEDEVNIVYTIQGGQT